tara:strand:+ start:1616 stop:2809 length:1194 start_codon:yes stop_codon:yes gene_type:complete
MINFKSLIKYKLIVFFLCFDIYSQDDNIASIELISKSNNSNNFIFFSSDFINVSFDELSSKIKNYYYTFEHCDYNWEKSTLFKNEFVEGFDDLRISNYQKSFNTLQKFINYSFNISNKKLKISGNYILTIKDDFKKEILKRKFIIVSDYNIGDIQISRAKANKIIDTHQSLKVTFNCIECFFENNADYKLLILKNNNFNDYKIINKPTFKTSKKLIYDNVIFQGGNEYLSFDTKNIFSTSNQIKRVMNGPIYKTILYNDLKKNVYSYNPDKNGEFIVNSDNENNSTDSDYTLVSFSLNRENDINENLFIVGGFNNHDIKEKYKLKKISKNKFGINLKLKQGYYNYKYVTIENGVLKDLSSFWETENDYSAILYQKKPTDRFYKIIGYGKNNSYKIVN